MSTGNQYVGPPGSGYAAPEREVGFGEMLSVLWRPEGIMRRVAANRQVLLGLIVPVLLAAIGVIGTLLTLRTSLQGVFDNPAFQDAVRQLPPGALEQFQSTVTVSGTLGALLSPFIMWLLTAGLVYLAARLLGGNGSFPAMLAVAGVAMLPQLLQNLINLPLSLITTPQIVGAAAGGGAVLGGGLLGIITTVASIVLGLGSLVWWIALTIVGTRFAMGFGDYGRPSGACALSCGGCLSLGLFLIFALVAIFSLTASGVGG